MMENYIVDPMIIYWLDTVPQLGGAIYTASWIASLALCLYYVIFVWCKHCVKAWPSVSDGEQSFIDATLGIRRKTRFVVILLVVMNVLGVMIPTQETLYKMLIAHYATVENVQATAAQGKEVVEFLTEQVKEVVEASKNKE